MDSIRSLSDVIVVGSAIYHVLMGVACIIGPNQIQKLLGFFYQIKFNELQKSHEFLLKPLGAFAVWTGFTCAYLALHPGPWTTYLKYSLAVLFIFRALLRIRYRQIFLEWLNVSWQRSRWNVLFNFCLAVGLVLA